MTDLTFGQAVVLATFLLAGSVALAAVALYALAAVADWWRAKCPPPPPPWPPDAPLIVGGRWAGPVDRRRETNTEGKRP